MDKYAPFVLWVYGATFVVLLAYVAYLFLRLRQEQRAAQQEIRE